MRGKVESTVAIIGGGPAGLSMAKFLTEAGLKCKVFEASGRLGGKSDTLQIGQNIVEMGTSYTTLEHRIVKKWLRGYNQPLEKLGEARFDGARVVDFVKQGGGVSLPRQAIRFMRELGPLRAALQQPDPDKKALVEASMTTLDWIRKLDLPKIELALYRLQTAQGYGRLDETSIGQTALWCTPKFVASGVLNRLNMPSQGWERLWQAIAVEFETVLHSNVSGIIRTPQGVDIVHRNGTERFDGVVCAIPVDAFARLTDQVRPSERTICESVHWTSYTTCLVAVEDWFTDHRVSGLSAALAPGAESGKMIGGRYEGYEAELGGHLYVTGQVSDDLTSAELAEILQADIEEQGARLKAVITQRQWKYFPRYTPEAVRDGLLDTLRQMQGEARTWYTGATFSHELISSIVQFNAGLSQSVATRLKDLARFDAGTKLGITGKLP